MSVLTVVVMVSTINGTDRYIHPPQKSKGGIGADFYHSGRALHGPHPTNRRSHSYTGCRLTS